MRLESGLFIGKDSLVSHGTAINTVADNLANSNTPGYKAERAEFATLLADGEGSLFGDGYNAGNGVFVPNINTVHNQGSIEQTNRSLDFAVQGQGLFITQNGTNTYYTRAGNFSSDPTGNLTTQDGDTVMGFTTASPDTPVALNLNTVASAAAPTTAIKLTGNLDSSQAAALSTGPFTTVTDLNANATYRNVVEMIDSLGNRHSVDMYFFKVDNLNWQAQAYVDGGEVGGTIGTPTNIGTGNIAFTNTGVQAAGAAPMTITAAWGNGAAASTVAVDLSGFTGYGSPSSISSITADGTIPGNPTGFEVDENGVLSATLSNGETATIGTIALAFFQNPSALEKVGNNKYVITEDAGTPDIGAPNSESRGQTKGSSLETSTVDPASEFVNMIRYQRGYQAGSQVIQTVNELLDQTIRIA